MPPAPSAAIYLTAASLAVLSLGLATILLARRYRRRRICAARIQRKESPSLSPPPSFPLRPQFQHPVDSPPTQNHLRHHSPPSQPQLPPAASPNPPRAAYLTPSGVPWTPLPPPGGPLPLPPPPSAAVFSSSTKAVVSVSFPPPLYTRAPARRHIIVAAVAAAAPKRGDDQDV